MVAPRRLAAVTAALVGAAAVAAACSAKTPFMAESQAARATMMAAMDVRSSGDADQDFVALMIPHHQGAIDMARAELRYGRNEQLRRLAQEIIVTQQQEITVMRLALGEPLTAPLPPHAQPPSTVSTDTQRGAHPPVRTAPEP
jgi:uncharacterized protein (DUF305 family)